MRAGFLNFAVRFWDRDVRSMEEMVTRVLWDRVNLITVNIRV